MSPKPAALIVASVVGLAAVAGVIVALRISPTSTSPGSRNVDSAPIPNHSSTPPQASNPLPQSPAPIPPSTTNTAPLESPESQPSTKPSRKVTQCVVQMARVNDPNPPLNVRSSPTAQTNNNLIGQLSNGTFVGVTQETDAWFRIATPLQGWVAKSNTAYTCGVKYETVKFGTGKTAAKISERIIGTGTHNYQFELAKGQRLRLVSHDGPLPSILAPDATPLTDLRETRTTWTGILPSSGNYTVSYESNFKGYSYSFTVQVD
jgi:hypothetical protein